MFTPHCSPRARSFRGLANFFVRPTFAEIRGIKLAYFPHTKPLKLTFRWPSYSPGVTSQNDYDFCMWESKVQRGAFRPRCFPATSGRGAGDAQIFAYDKLLYPCRMLLHGTSDLKTRNSEDGCTFPPNVFTPTPKITKAPFWGTFQCKAYYTWSCTLMELRSWNFTVI